MFNFIKTHLSFYLLISIFFSLSLAAQENESLEIELPKVNIKQSKIKTEQIKPEIVHIISQEQIKSGFKNLPQLLSHISGFRINQLGGHGQNATILVRGSRSQHVQFFIDGIPISSGITNSINISKIPLAGIEKIEIYRSYVPSQLQTGNLGAAINLISKKEVGNQLYAYSKIQLGSFNTIKQTGELIKSTKKHSFSISTEYISTKNNFKFHNDRGTPFNTKDDSVDKKSNNGFKNFYLSGNLAITQKNLHQSFSLKSNIGEQKIGGPQNTIITKAKNSFSNLNFDYNIKPNESIENFDWSAKVHLGHDKNVFFDPLAEVGFAKNHTTNKTNNVNLQLLMNYTFSDEFETSLSTFLSKKNSKKSDSIQSSTFYWKRNSLISAIETTYQKNQLQFKLKAQWQYISDKVFLIDNDTNNFNHADAHLSFLYLINNDMMFKLNAGKNARTPSLFELFGDKGLTIGNQDLTNESAWYGEAYFQWNKSNDHFSIHNSSSIYFKRVENLISYEQISAGLSRPKNIDQSEMFGIESQINLSWKRFLNANINYAYTHAINNSGLGIRKNTFIPGIPQHTLNTIISINYKKWQLSYTTQLLSKEYLDELNLKENNSRILHDILLSYTYKKINFELEVRNIGDNQYEDFINYPLPGRSYWFGITIKF